MKQLQIALALMVAAIVVAYNIRRCLLSRHEKHEQAYAVTLFLRQGEQALTESSAAEKGQRESRLTETGAVVERIINRLHEANHRVTVDDYAILPNRVHLLIMIDTRRDLLEPLGLSLRAVVSALTRACSKRLGRRVWEQEIQSRLLKDEEELSAYRRSLRSAEKAGQNA